MFGVEHGKMEILGKYSSGPNPQEEPIGEVIKAEAAGDAEENRVELKVMPLPPAAAPTQRQRGGEQHRRDVAIQQFLTHAPALQPELQIVFGASARSKMRATLRLEFLVSNFERFVFGRVHLNNGVEILRD